MDYTKKEQNGFFGKLTRAVLPIMIIALGICCGVYLIKTRPVAEKRRPEPQVTRVDVMAAVKGVNKVIIPAMGTIQPARQVDLSAQVSGKIIDVSSEFVPGGRFLEGQLIVSIDPADYKLLTEQRSSDLQAAQAEYRIEQGQQAIAKHGYELLGETFSDEDEEFVLRKPQLSAKEAAVDMAKAKLAQARIDLTRTTVTAPFNCMIIERFADKGTSVNVGGKLVSIVGIDEYWIEVSVPMDELKWLVIPDNRSAKGSKAKVFTPGSNGSGAYRTGYITAIRGNLEESSRMARVIISIKKPLETDAEGKAAAPMLIGAFVKAQIEGIPLAGSVKIPRKALRDGGIIWIYGKDDTLEIREAAPAYKDSEYVYFSKGIEDGELIITSDIPAAIESMRLEIADRGDK